MLSHPFRKKRGMDGATQFCAELNEVGWGIMLSHPFRKERGMDGAPMVAPDWAAFSRKPGLTG